MSRQNSSPPAQSLNICDKRGDRNSRVNDKKSLILKFNFIDNEKDVIDDNTNCYFVSIRFRF